MTSAQVKALLKTAVFSVLVPGVVALYVPYRILGPFPRPQAGLLTWAGALLVVLGTAIYLRCAWDFAITGLGTPAIFDPPTVLVVRGMHRYVRNPMYVGVLSVIFGEAAVSRAKPLFIYGGVVWLFFHLFVMFYEEPHLRGVFGESYEEYRRSVRRWLPRF